MKKFVKLSAVFMAVILSLCCMSCKSDDDDDDKETVLADKTVEIPASGYQYFDINLSKSATVSLNVKVTKGSGVEIYAIDKSDYEDLKAGKDFEYYEDFSSDVATKEFSVTATATAGHAYFVLVNRDSSAQTVYTKIVLK
ncbi:hypothetical protein [uncultured Treponema sp.]|uniref:hypothetical protein n=1 Tax=uncultured Treponema sp. TaxID=162155 RepID=UPI0025993CDF|nr:hypothetical protein [uncultured Treponema sp.]